MRRLGRTWPTLALLAVVLAVGGATAWVVTFGPPSIVFRMLGTGGYAPYTARATPHPFSFEGPRLWRYTTGQPDSSATYFIFVQGPSDGVRFVQLHLEVGMASVLGGKYTSLQQFADVFLPSERIQDRQKVMEGVTTIAGRWASDMAYTYVFLGVQPRGQRVPSRGRAVFFEDRDYFYMLEFSAPEADYDQYAEVFNRAVASFEFLE